MEGFNYLEVDHTRIYVKVKCFKINLNMLNVTIAIGITQWADCKNVYK